MGTPEIRYARSGDVALAYQVTGDGPIDLVFVPGWISNIELAWELHGQEVTGMAVHVAARVAGLAEPAQILATSTVKDLVLGSGIRFAPQRTAELKGVPGSWQLYAFRRA